MQYGTFKLPEKKCHDCRFWRRGSDPSECMRYPPVFAPRVQLRGDANGNVIDTEEIVAQRPITKRNDFCGEWQP